MWLRRSIDSSVSHARCLRSGRLLLVLPSHRFRIFLSNFDLPFTQHSNTDTPCPPSQSTKPRRQLIMRHADQRAIALVVQRRLPTTVPSPSQRPPARARHKVGFRANVSVRVAHFTTCQVPRKRNGSDIVADPENDSLQVPKSKRAKPAPAKMRKSLACKLASLTSVLVLTLFVLFL